MERDFTLDLAVYVFALILITGMALEGCDTTKKIARKAWETTTGVFSTSKPAPCSKTNPCKDGKHCLKGKCVICRDNRDCNGMVCDNHKKCVTCRKDSDCKSMNPKLPVCMEKKKCVQCKLVYEQGTWVTNDCNPNYEVCQENKCVIDYGGQVLFALATFAAVFLLLGIRVGFDEFDKYALQIGIVNIVTGVLLGVFTPVYLNMGGWGLVAVIIIGGFIFFTGGLAYIAFARWGNVGLSIGFLGNAWLLHFVSRYTEVIGPDPSAFKGFVIANLIASTIFITTSLNLTENQRRREPQMGKGKIIIAALGGIATLAKFVNLILEYLGRM